MISFVHKEALENMKFVMTGIPFESVIIIELTS